MVSFPNTGSPVADQPFRYRFPKSARLLKRRQFQRVQKQLRRPGQYVLVCALLSKQKSVKLGITVSRRYGNAVLRNRFKRMVREAFRQILPHLPQGWHYVVFPRFAARDATTQQILQDFLCVLKNIVT